MKPGEFSDILQKYINGGCTDEERIIVERWCDYILEKERKTIYPFESKTRMHERIARANGTRHSMPAGKIRFFGITDAVAAAVVIAALCFTQFNGVVSTNYSDLVTRASSKDSNAVVINNTASPMKVHFEDGTEVVLEPKSKLSGVTFTREVRKLRLEGKAFFNVARNPKRPFYIYTKNITTRVLGTSFIIDAQTGGEETVEVKTGRVAVYKTEKNEVKSQDSFVTVTPNLQVHYSQARQALIPSIVEHPVVIPTTEHDVSRKKTSAPPPSSLKMEFAGVRIVDVFKALETAYGIRIKCDAGKLGNCIMTITLIDEDLYTRLRAICVAIGASYKIDGTEIVIENGGC